VKAAVCRAFGAPLEIEDLRLDPPDAAEVRVKVAVCAICQSDIHFAAGAWGGTLPAVYGHEAAGVVEEAGPGVRRVRRGDRVVVSLLRSCGRCFFCERNEPQFCDTEFALDREGRLRTADGEPVLQAMHTGAFAEEVVVHESQLVVVPRTMPLDAASLLGCGVITGVGAVVNTAAVPAGSSVVVIGAGGVGLNAVQGAVLCGAQPIIAVDVSAAKLDAAMRFGATHTVDAARGDLVPDVRAVVDERGADYVFVTVGEVQAIEQGLACIRKGGTLVVVGMPPSGVTFRVVAVDLADRGVRILGSKMGSVRLELAVPWLAELYGQDRLKLDELVTDRYPLEQINEAIAAAGKDSTLRTVIVFDTQ
jgi:Zn-dependent alcohol dehydrogenase